MVVINVERKIIDQEELMSILGRFKEKLQEEEVPFSAVYLFGSYATGEADRDSDIDIAVILPSSISVEVRNKFYDIWIWAKDIHVKNEVHILSTGDMANRYLSLPFYVKKDGIKI